MRVDGSGPVVGSLPRWCGTFRRGLSVGLIVFLATVGVVAAAGLALVVVDDRPGDLTASLPLPSWLEALSRRNGVAYRAHAGFGTALNALGAPPSAAGIQWLKAAAHVRSSAEVDHVARGIAATRQRSADANHLDTVLCTIAAEGTRGRHVAALARAGLVCGEDSAIWGAVPDDVPISYSARPPTGGLFRDAPHPEYGVADQAVPPEAWVHNLAHGAIVLLYNCPQDCPELVAQAQDLRDLLPPGRNARDGAPRLLATPYTEMDHPITVVAWGRLLELDRFDRDQIRAFYVAYLDRGPECRELACPE